MHINNWCDRNISHTCYTYTTTAQCTRHRRYTTIFSLPSTNKTVNNNTELRKRTIAREEKKIVRFSLFVFLIGWFFTLLFVFFWMCFNFSIVQCEFFFIYWTHSLSCCLSISPSFSLFFPPIFAVTSFFQMKFRVFFYFALRNWIQKLDEMVEIVSFLSAWTF